MQSLSTSGDYRPVTWVQRFPVYITTILVALCGLGMIATQFMISAGQAPLWAGFHSAEFLRGALWQPLTYCFVDTPNFFSIFSLIFLYIAGIEVEKYLGRTRFLQLVSLALAAPVVVLLLWHVADRPSGHSGSYEFTIGMFIAFATLYPNMDWFGFVPLKWFAFAGLVLASMSYLPGDWIGMSVLWSVAALSFGYIRFLQHDGAEQVADFVGKKFRGPSVAGASGHARRPARPAPRREPEEDSVESIDPILDKIAEHGLASLTAKERAKLERARAALLARQD